MATGKHVTRGSNRGGIIFEPREEIIEKVVWNGEEEVEIHFKKSSIWAGAKRKDFWNPDDNWESKIIPGAVLRLWTVSWSIMLGFELLENGEWISVWCKANNFQYKAEREKSSKGYADFIQEEGNKIALWIDEGKALEEIDKLISDDHTGNTYGWALSIGIGKAKNKENAEKIKSVHNVKYNVTDSDGVVNPAVLTISIKGDSP